MCFGGTPGPLGVSTSTGVSPKVNKFEYVSSVDHQVSVGVGVGTQVQCPKGGGGRRVGARFHIWVG